jgi:hypothetical protein
MKQFHVFVEINMKSPESIYRVLLESGNNMADLEHTYRLLSDATKSILAQLTIEAKNLENCSMSEAKEIALCAHTYRDHLTATSEAHRMAERAKILYFSSKTLSDLYRSQEATERAIQGRAT